MKLEVVVVPVSDVDRAKRFYETLGWWLDAEFVVGEGFRVVQLTPPGSECSIIIGDGITTAVPGGEWPTYYAERLGAMVESFGYATAGRRLVTP